MDHQGWELRRNSGPDILEMSGGPADFGNAWKRYDVPRARPVSSKPTAVTRSQSASRRYPAEEKKLTRRSKSNRAMVLPRGASSTEKKPAPSKHKGDFTRLTNRAAKLLASADALSNGRHDLIEGGKKWIVIVYTDAVFGMNSGFKFFIKLHGRKRSSKLIELQHSETNKFKFQSDQADVFTVVLRDVGDVEKVTIGFRGIRPGITWRVGMVRLVDANDSETVLEFPIDRDLDGDECYITMPREDLVFNESLFSSRLTASHYFELISSNVCQHPDGWYQFGGCQLHVPELGVCTVSQRSGESGPSGLMQDVTSILKWSKVYRVAFKAKLVSRQLVKSGGQVQCLLLSKQENRPKFDLTVLATDILYSNHHSKLIEGKLEPGNLLEGGTTDFQKAFLCFVTNSIADINLEVENPMLLDENDITTNLLKNARFEVRTQVPEFWRSVGIGNLERKIVHNAKAIALKEKPFTSTGIAVNVKSFIKPDKNYQFSCDVILYLTDKEELNRNGEVQKDKAHMDDKAGIFCCLLTSRDPDENWHETSGGDFQDNESTNKRRNESKKYVGHLSDIVTTISFTQVANFKKFTKLEGMFRIENRIPDMAVIALYCTEESQKFAVANATLKIIKPANLNSAQQ